MRRKLLQRAHDKEAPIRVQVAVALSKLSRNEDPEELADDEEVLYVPLLEALTYDGSAYVSTLLICSQWLNLLYSEVRRSLVSTIPINSTTLEPILKRTGDKDSNVRKQVFLTLKENISQQGFMGPTHPRCLTIAQREFLVKKGLNDRENSVKKAAQSLLGAWLDAVTKFKSDAEDGTALKEEDPEGRLDPFFGLIRFLEMFDLAEPVAAEALSSVFVLREAMFFSLKFEGELRPLYWSCVSQPFQMTIGKHCAPKRCLSGEFASIIVSRRTQD